MIINLTTRQLSIIRVAINTLKETWIENDWYNLPEIQAIDSQIGRLLGHGPAEYPPGIKK